MERYIPVVISVGEPFARGLHLGRSEKGRVQHTVNAYMRIFENFAGLSHEAVFKQAERFMPAIASFAPHLLEEIRGIAEGAQCDVREIVAINARTELMYGVTHRPECTSIAISAAASADGHTRVAQNWDWHPSLVGTLVLWLIKRSDGPDVLTLTEAGIVGKMGINSVGLAMCINLLRSDSDSSGPAAPMHIILRRVLEECRDVDEAIELIVNTRRCTSCNHMLADRSGAIADVEATPTGQWVHHPEHGILTHTNHCTNPVLASQDRYAREYPETRERDSRMQMLAKARPITESHLRAMLADHATSPYSICLHNDADWSFIEQSESIASVIIDATGETLDVADGPPCEHGYQRYSLNQHMNFIA
ncbi:MAG: C45 family autoproteolytic acyltransferase/hydrolase [Ktedonobacteraceae bacterium]